MRSLGWALIHYDWCPYKKQRLAHRCTEREGHVNTQGGDGCLHAKGGGLGKSSPADTLSLDDQSPEL